jgi:hypothetical protein
MSHVNVITAGQLERIRAKVLEAVGAPHAVAQHIEQNDDNTPVAQVATVSEETRKEEERLRLKTLSEERANKWPNTLQVRQGKLCCTADDAAHNVSSQQSEMSSPCCRPPGLAKSVHGRTG